MSNLLVRHRKTVFALSIAVFAGCKESTSSPPPAAVQKESTSVAEDTVATVVTPSPTFTVRDADGNTLGGVSVTVAVTAGGGTLTDAPTKSLNGPTPVGTWKLGNTVGVNSVTVTVSGVPPLVISVNGKAGPPASMVFVTGNNQAAVAGDVLPVAPVVQVRDAFNNPVAGGTVTFTIQDGEGSLSSATPVTADAQGNATAPQWTLGRSAVTQTLRASSGALSALATALVISSYNVDLRFFGPAMPPATGAMFTAAAARIRGAITGDVADLPLTAIPNPVDIQNSCGSAQVTGLPTAFQEAIDDVIIYASVGAIDGANQILAFSFPCFVRAPFPARQTLIGIMKFDVDDLEGMIARGNLTDVILHEMLHVIGIGTLWNSFGWVQGAGTSATRYTGPEGLAGCIAMGGTPVCPGSVPLENSGGAGTIDSHWRDNVFFNELMTGFVNTRQSVPTGILNPLSIMTIRSLTDVGYSVNAKAADPYVIPGQSGAQILGQLSVDPTPFTWEKVEHPRFEISRTGRITRVDRQ